MSMPKMSDYQVAQYSWVLSQGHGWVSKFKILVTHIVWTHVDSLGEHLAALQLVLVCPRKEVAWLGVRVFIVHWLGVYSKTQQKSSTKICSWCLCSYAIEQDSTLVLPLQRGSATIFKCTLRRETISVWSRGSSDRPHYLLLILLPPSPSKHC